MTRPANNPASNPANKAAHDPASIPAARPTDDPASYEFSAPLWKWTGEAAWYFVTVPAEISDEIEYRTALTKRGFGSVRVQVTVGRTTWLTSIFPDSKAQAYVLPVKAAVRRAESLIEAGAVEIRLELVTT